MIIFLTAICVGGATIVGAILGFLFRHVQKSFQKQALSFASGVMLSASISGLIIPSLECGGRYSIFVMSAGIFSGAACITFFEKRISYLYAIVGETERSDSVDHILLFVSAIALHNLPEGIAAGVSLGSGDMTRTVLISGAIAIQNIPEGMIIIVPMLHAGFSPKKSFIYAVLTGVIEIVGTYIGYYVTIVSAVLLPYALAFAGGTMLYVICDEMIPDAKAEDVSNYATYALLTGFCFLFLINEIIG